MNSYSQHGLESHAHHLDGMLLQVLLPLPFVFMVILYLLAVVMSNRRYTVWPVYRTCFWILGSGCALLAVIGPLADRSHTDFSVHMIGHLLLGMLAPLLMVLAAPMTLFLRTLPVNWARRLTTLLKSRLSAFYTHPILTSLLNMGGLWVLYTTDVYLAMQHSALLHVLVHLHVFMAGYLFTMSMIYIDPLPHQVSFRYRAVVMILAFASHGILSKYLYAYPSNGIPVAQAEMGGMLMYYGGDAIDLVLICIFCYQWYRSTRPPLQAGQGAYG